MKGIPYSRNIYKFNLSRKERKRKRERERERESERERERERGWGRKKGPHCHFATKTCEILDNRKVISGSSAVNVSPDFGPLITVSGYNRDVGPVSFEAK